MPALGDAFHIGTDNQDPGDYVRLNPEPAGAVYLLGPRSTRKMHLWAWSSVSTWVYELFDIGLVACAINVIEEVDHV